MSKATVLLTGADRRGRAVFWQGCRADSNLASASSVPRVKAWLFLPSGPVAVQQAPPPMPEIALARDVSGNRVTLYDGAENRLPPTFETVAAYAENRDLVLVDTMVDATSLPAFLVPEPTHRPSAFALDVRLLIRNYSEAPDFEANVLYNSFIAHILNPREEPSSAGSQYDAAVRECARSTPVSAGAYLPVEVSDVDASGGTIVGVLRVDETGTDVVRATLFLSQNTSSVQPGAILRRRVRWTQNRETLERNSEIASVVALR